MEKSKSALQKREAHDGKEEKKNKERILITWKLIIRINLLLGALEMGEFPWFNIFINIAIILWLQSTFISNFSLHLHKNLVALSFTAASRKYLQRRKSVPVCKPFQSR